MTYSILLDMRKRKPLSEETKRKISESNTAFASSVEERAIRSERLKRWWAETKVKNPEKISSMRKKMSENNARPSLGKGMDKNPAWKGGRRVDKRDGYVILHRPDHPDCRKDGSILEHRLIMESVVGRRLNKDEDVNHVNGKKDDNRPENLKLVRHSAHYEPHVCPKCDFNWWTR